MPSLKTPSELLDKYRIWMMMMMMVDVDLGEVTNTHFAGP